MLASRPGQSTELNSNRDDIALISLGLSFKYLESLLLASQTLPFSEFHSYKGTSSGAYLNAKDFMTLNGNALENLEIFLTSSH